MDGELWMGWSWPTVTLEWRPSGDGVLSVEDTHTHTLSVEDTHTLSLWRTHTHTLSGSAEGLLFCANN